MREVFSENPIRPMEFALCAAGLMALLVMALAIPGLGGRAFRGPGRLLSRLARNRSIAVLLVMFASLSVSMLTTLIAGVPLPKNHDEFSYLLSGDTFAHGRLTNPQHPMWRHFETVHVFHEPTFMSKFGPAQGLTLAFGQAATGLPIVGVWLSTALACGALTWALFGWTRPKWALAGGLLAALHPQVIFWSQMYWGGTVGMIGGSLIAGAIPRLVRSMRPRDAVWGAAGFAILINCRPYEGAVWAFVGGTTLATALLVARRTRRPIGPVLARVAAPALAVLVPVGAFMMYYNHRLTGSAGTLPYTHHAQLYMPVPLFFWGKQPPPKTYRHKALADQHAGWEGQLLARRHDPAAMLAWTVVKYYYLVKDCLLRALPLAAGLLVLPWAMRGSAWTKIGLLYLLAFVIAWSIIPWYAHHYVGAVFAVLVAVALRGLRWIDGWRPRNRKRVGRAFVRLCMLSAIAVAVPTIAKQRSENHRPAWYRDRARLVEELKRIPGKHLVIVRYGLDHSAFDEWVSNGADLDGAPILFAREMSPGETRELIEYFADRRAWLLDADVPAAQPVPYPAP